MILQDILKLTLTLNIIVKLLNGRYNFFVKFGVVLFDILILFGSRYNFFVRLGCCFGLLLTF